MRDGFRADATQATRTDLLLETLALRHQLGVLARSRRRFRPIDRLLWLLLRWVWPRWREALVLVQPATVERWYREGVRRCWRRRGRPGRPRIDSSARDLIWRMAAENCLWGAPRIHGELLKLGIDISERTVSRYLRTCPRPRSQTWRTFFANHFAATTLASPETVTDAQGEDVVADAFGLSFDLTQLSINGFCVSAHWAANCTRSLQSTVRKPGLRQERLQDRPGARESMGRAPPSSPWLQRHGVRSLVPCVCAFGSSATDGTIKVVAVRRTIGYWRSTLQGRAAALITFLLSLWMVAEARWRQHHTPALNTRPSFLPSPRFELLPVALETPL
jgi:hypothetical protein